MQWCYWPRRRSQIDKLLAGPGEPPPPTIPSHPGSNFKHNQAEAHNTAPGPPISSLIGQLSVLGPFNIRAGSCVSGLNECVCVWGNFQVDSPGRIVWAWVALDEPVGQGHVSWLHRPGHLLTNHYTLSLLWLLKLLTQASFFVRFVRLVM